LVDCKFKNFQKPIHPENAAKTKKHIAFKNKYLQKNTILLAKFYFQHNASFLN